MEQKELTYKFIKMHYFEGERKRNGNFDTNSMSTCHLKPTDYLTIFKTALQLTYEASGLPLGYAGPRFPLK